MTEWAAWVVAIGNVAMVGWQLVAVRNAFRKAPIKTSERLPEPQPALS
jgi:hypothetical protein